jgi:hypothetical protein
MFFLPLLVVCNGLLSAIYIMNCWYYSLTIGEVHVLFIN